MMSGDHNQYQKPDKCERCGEVSPAQGLTDEEIREFEIWLDDEEEKHGWNLPADIVKYIEAKLKEKNGGRKYITHEPAPQRQPEPVGWIYEDDEGRMIFSQMPHPDPLWEPVYRAQK
jgi:hypothetical protein